MPRLVSWGGLDAGMCEILSSCTKMDIAEMCTPLVTCLLTKITSDSRSVFHAVKSSITD